LRLEDGASIQARAVVIATGARYRKLDVQGFEKFEGQGIYYAATAMEADLCRHGEVIVVGGGNSAGQAAVFLAGSVKHVYVLVRGRGLAATMSDYLVQRIEQSAHISVHAHCEITALDGEHALSGATWRDHRSGVDTKRPVSAIFAMIGAEPNTRWLGDCLTLDAQGFVVTGTKAGAAADSPYATSRPGIYAVGDVRSSSVKRVASGVGEGSVVVQAVHRFLHPAPE
jgi:thioredoxin reductase (NADPH)